MVAASVFKAVVALETLAQMHGGALAPGTAIEIDPQTATPGPRRLAPAVPDGGTLAAKSGGLFGRVRNEIGVISYPAGPAYAFAILTHASEAFRRGPLIDTAMAAAVDTAIRALRRA